MVVAIHHFQGILFKIVSQKNASRSIFLKCFQKNFSNILRKAFLQKHSFKRILPKTFFQKCFLDRILLITMLDYMELSFSVQRSSEDWNEEDDEVRNVFIRKVHATTMTSTSTKMRKQQTKKRLN